MRRRRLRVGEDAGTQIVAVAAFHVLAAQVPGLLRHADLSFAWWGECSRHLPAG
jgi:hypothetical protein